VLEEYVAVRDAAMPGCDPVLLLVPALPSAGRITVDGVHLIERDGDRVPLHETEYARDGVFAYRDARLLTWAEDRSGGWFRAARGRGVSLGELRREGPAAVAGALDVLAAAAVPAVLAPDAETVEDVDAIARGYEQAVARGVRVIVRCAPLFAGVLARTTARGTVPVPRANGGGLLVVCGSYVPTTTRQLGRLTAEARDTLVEVDVEALASDDPEAEIDRAADAASALLRHHELAVVATPRERSPRASSLEAGGRIASALARVAGAVEPRPPVVIAKGGITAAITLREGFGIDEAEVVGPVLPGVSHWRGDGLDYLVVPGNVGDDDLLVELVRSVMRG
jgi:uncharacterized protein YgbK (DUF1537 family)